MYLTRWCREWCEFGNNSMVLSVTVPQALLHTSSSSRVKFLHRLVQEAFSKAPLAASPQKAVME